MRYSDSNNYVSEIAVFTVRTMQSNDKVCVENAMQVKVLLLCEAIVYEKVSAEVEVPENQLVSFMVDN